MTTTFVGRTAELEVIEGLLAGLSEGRGGALGILGEAGIGKTRLLAGTGRACRHAGVSGASWLRLGA